MTYGIPANSSCFLAWSAGCSLNRVSFAKNTVMNAFAREMVFGTGTLILRFYFPCSL